MIEKTLGNRYTILEEIGGGGMAVVYRARDTLLNRIVAIKVLRPEFSGHNDFVRRFRREAQAAASLSHPNIVSIYDVGQQNGLYYIVMEYIEGKTLKELIKLKAPMPPMEVIEIGKQICDALECAHKNKIVHRDIKSHNIIITPEGRVKVADFGIARATADTTITNTGSVFGSVHYFSPEQARSDMVDERSDIYSLGVVLYEALAGKLPFEGQTPVAIALKQIQDSPSPISNIIPGFPEELEAIIEKCMAKSPDERFQSAAELKRELNEVSQHSDIVNFKPSELEHTLVLNNTQKEQFSKTSPKIQNSVSRKARKSSIFRNIAIVLLVIALFSAFSYLGAVWARKYFEVPEVSVPNVIGKSEEEASAELAQKNLKYTADRVFDKAPDGQVIDQDPKGGETVKVNHPPISLVISKGPKTSKVPRIVGSSEQDGIAMLTNNGFAVGSISREYSDEFPEGVILDQNPRADLSLPEGTAINFTVSLGPEIKQSNTPVLIGKTLDDAKKLLEEQKLQIGTITKKSSDAVPENTVMDQSPRPGDPIGPEGTVDLVVSSGPLKIKKLNLSIPLPSKPSEFAIKVIVSDDLDENRLVYNKRHTPQDSPLIIPIEGAGVMNVEVWLDNTLLLKESY
ncbi:Stk1 family PASTA domain-containing Ser/Thr kinase [Biomaibacter acetigenes]|uniref:non-specific serine/threonine protein kinase n=1 Tax=Biomaibacter acetigenes TaxID=2316383 RepID=A0A3G2R5N3_9FIRM|nr:Stk1 family PASTA domain-containing Ser/Thr kinase [Biomaibacter acetigenes]AYO30408.1 Stk1 family PASTA domain-containing Ser/Thr kinase [Biomaibacter acetigenes]MDN5312332.1 eukaryotic-like serine/threonine-protein kinase [Thermoanaerobacteraceae bacterium]RKL63165.1 Stk1 family PASTA domain-containing Ser/Thr kinase [Thermoanaerobacteraceae bacterium SP2]